MAQSYKCSNGCEDGKCLSSVDSCVETDGAYNPNKKGDIEIKQNGGTITGSDSCFDASFDVPDGTSSIDLVKMFYDKGLTLTESSSGAYIMETTCASYTLEGQKTYLVAQSYKCSNGCEDGVCKSEPIEKDECSTALDCKDNNACTQDTCSGTPKKCSNTPISTGCSIDENCIPIGTRINEQYCDIGNELKNQKSKEVTCNNNYECTSNICINNKCISPSFIQKIINWFMRLFGG